ncbi:MAG: peptidylprolyl isomerase [Oscillospiraceae bacterium]|nr:peptidylprolyl isomerase [Oscillospiraceae bacterium]
MDCVGFDGIKDISTAELIKAIRKAIRVIAISGQSYRIGSRILTRADMTELRRTLEYFEGERAKEEAGAAGMTGAHFVKFEPR